MSSILTRRAIAFLLALVLALVAVLALLSYVRSVEAEALGHTDTVFGFVATDRVETGTLIDTAIQLGAVEQREIPRTLLAPGAVTDLTQVSGRVVQELILAGDQLVLDRFAAPGQGVQVLTIPPDHQAISVQLELPPGVAGFLRDGDHIGVIAYMSVPIEGTTVEVTDTATGATTIQSQTEQRAQYLLQDVEVLSVGRRLPPSEEDPSGGTTQSDGSVLLTLAVTPDEAERLVLGALGGSLWATLFPEDETAVVATPGRSARDLFAN